MFVLFYLPSSGSVSGASIHMLVDANHYPLTSCVASQAYHVYIALTVCCAAGWMGMLLLRKLPTEAQVDKVVLLIVVTWADFLFLYFT